MKLLRCSPIAFGDKADMLADYPPRRYAGARFAHASEETDMNDLSRDPIINVVHGQVRRGIRVALDNDCYASAVILIYSGIDTMAYLSMPREQQYVTPDDFVRWADRYIRFPCEEQVSGLELYAARCAMVHTHGIASPLSRQDRVRQIGYVDRSVPEVSYNPRVSEDLVMVSVEALAEAFFGGSDRALIDLFADEQTAPVAEQRLNTLVHRLPFRNCEP